MARTKSKPVELTPDVILNPELEATQNFMANISNQITDDRDLVNQLLGQAQMAETFGKFSQTVWSSKLAFVKHNKLYQSLKVPLGRLQPQQGFTLGRSTEITREELKFQKFIDRLRKKFSGIFKDALRIQLITKGIINAEEWDDFISRVRFDFMRDNHFTELKDAELMMNRMGMLQQIDP